MKNKTIIAFAAMLIGTMVSGYFGPWWAPAIFIILLSGLMRLSIRQGIVTGSMSLVVTYLLVAFLMSGDDQADIIQKTGELMGAMSSFVMLLLTAFIGAITGLFSGWLGSTLGSLFEKTAKQ